MIDSKLQQAINHQINQELLASYTYLAMGAYLDRRNLVGFAKWMQKQSEEERTHAHRLIRYLLDRNGDVKLDAISSPGSDFGTPHEVFARSLEQERANTAAIYKLYETAKNLNDYATIAHLQWFLDEQVEEEKTVSEILGRLELAGENPAALLMLDAEVGARPAVSAERGGGE